LEVRLVAGYTWFERRGTMLFGWRMRHVLLGSTFMLRSWALRIALGLCAYCSGCDQRQIGTLEKSAQVSVAESPAEISFGRRQVDQMLADRPDMVGILDEDDPIFCWIVDGMNGGIIGQRIYWNANTPESGSAAEHASPYEGYPPHVCISGGTEITGHDRWACAVYELFNIKNTKEFEDAYTKAMAGTLDGDAYAKECARLEYIALTKAKEFFKKHPLPNAKPGHHEEYEQITGVPATFEEYLALYHAPDGTFHHPGQYFKDYYDDVIAPYLKSMQEAKDLAEDGDMKTSDEPEAKPSETNELAPKDSEA
jgi:hypothetical protein